VRGEAAQHELEQRLVIAERDECLRLEWARYDKKEEEKAAVKATKKANREDWTAKVAARKKEREDKAAMKAKEKKNSVGPSTIVLPSSSSFEWTSTPVSSATPGRRTSIGIPSSLG
jgi:hypothetical protein